jgi:hypothetical protein
MHARPKPNKGRVYLSCVFSFLDRRVSLSVGPFKDVRQEVGIISMTQDQTFYRLDKTV